MKQRGWWVGCGLWLAAALWAGAAAAQVAGGFGERLAQVEKQVNEDAPAAVAAAREILAGAQAAGDASARAEARRVLGVALNIAGDNAAASVEFERAASEFEALGQPARVALVHRHRGVVAHDVGDYDRALEHYLAALRAFESLGETVDVAKTRANIANVYLKVGDTETAIGFQREALAAFEAARLPIGIAGSALNLGAALVQLSGEDAGRPRQRALLDEAAASYRKAREIFRGLAVTRGVQKAEANLAMVLERQGDLEGAARGLERARALAAEIGDAYEETLALKRLMEVEGARGRPEIALEYALAGIESSSASDAAGEESFQREASRLQEALGNPEAALRHARRAEELSQLRLDRDSELRLAELRREFDLRERDRELQALRQAQALDQAQLARQRVQRNAALVIGALALGVLALVASRLRLRERIRRELEQAVATDPLTGLLNRRGLRALVGRRDPQREYALVVCDIDNFKQVNDAHGHDVGDLVLAECARRLRAELRPDDCAARWGGEEFLVWLADGDAGSAAAVAERLRAAMVGAPFEQAPAGLAVTLSLGVAASGHGQGFDAIVRAADQALLQAKREGKNRVVVAASKVRALAPAGVAPARAARG